MMTLDLKIEEEVIEKLTKLLVKKNPTFEARETERIFGRIQLNNNRDIHNFVKAVTGVIKELEPETKIDLQKIQSQGYAPEVNLEEVSKALEKVNFSSNADRNIVYNYIKKSLN